MTDPVAQPDHYRLGGIEVIDAICAWGFGEGFNRGNAIKYIARAGRKDPAKTVEDLRKAARYLEMEIRRLLGEPMTQDSARGEPDQTRRDWPGKPDPMPYETRESYRCTPIGTAIADSVPDENGRHHVVVQLDMGHPPIPADADEQARAAVAELDAKFRLDSMLPSESESNALSDNVEAFMRSMHALRDDYVKAWCAATGLFPTQCWLVQQTHEDGRTGVYMEQLGPPLGTDAEKDATIARLAEERHWEHELRVRAEARANELADTQAAETIERLRKELANEQRRRVAAEKMRP